MVRTRAIRTGTTPVRELERMGGACHPMFLREFYSDRGFSRQYQAALPLGQSCYFFPGDNEIRRRKAIANAETFYRIFSPAPHQEGVILEGKWCCPSMLFARGDAWNAANDVYLRLLRDLIGDFTASPLPNAQKFFLGDEISKPVAWTLFSEALPDIDAVTIDTDAPGLGQQTFEVLGVFRDCMPKDLREVGRIEACPTPQAPLMAVNNPSTKICLKTGKGGPNFREN